MFKKRVLAANKKLYKQFYITGLSTITVLLKKPLFLYSDFGYHFAKKNLLILFLLFKID